ncbi:PP2C family protein-serine/threonine phosphatase [Sphingomonas sp. Leaf343]|uniref:PP2C family protein-serine/threonine phosphatase n=1 Tax=Sphingomonas sp. Leaf343 TaxID=1736345 RepID=UPI0006F9B12E|nr:protein phosphatase 2C domain-containing protein [Sphingomonas sp. Leaf343]KQR84079.1 hypothetical protein ASG07_05620 [Sphingomonas sp. Leaf343]
MTAPAEAAALSHVGCVRTANEDSVMTHPGGTFWAVADGMGGHARGDWASQTVVARLGAVALTGNLDHDCEAVADALAAANAEVVEAGRVAGRTIGTTVAALLLAEGRAACLWVGDSRVYRLRGGTLRQMTRDHSQVDQLVAAGIIRPEEAADHPLANVVTRAIGGEPDLALDVVEDALSPGDVFLVCSDGLNKCLSDAEIAGLLAGAPSSACDALVRAVLARGAPDNVSVVVVRQPG